MKMACKYLIICVLLATSVVVTPLKIPNKNVLVSIQDGSPEVLLDCLYELDKGDEKGLVIKWFYESEETPAFQWIPKQNSPPQAIGFLRGKIDVGHVVTDDPYSKHRALYFKNPSLDLNGMYSCFVSNFEREDRTDIQLTVYIPPNNFTIEYSEREEDLVTFFCKADGVFPEPIIDFYYEEDNGAKIKIMDTNVSVEFDNDTQTYNACMYKSFYREELQTSNSLVCTLHILQSDYYLDAGLIYYTGSSGVYIVDNINIILGLFFSWYIVCLKS